MWHCNNCTAAYPPAPCCPHCRADDHHDQGEPPAVDDGDERCPHCDHEDDEEDEADMARTTRLGGPTNSRANPPAGDAADEAVEVPADGTVAVLEGDGTDEGALDPLEADELPDGALGTDEGALDPLEADELPDGALGTDEGALDPLEADELEGIDGSDLEGAEGIDDVQRFRPVKKAPVDAWEGYVALLGYDDVDGAGLTKPELIELADKLEADRTAKAPDA